MTALETLALACTSSMEMYSSPSVPGLSQAEGGGFSHARQREKQADLAVLHHKPFGLGLIQVHRRRAMPRANISLMICRVPNSPPLWERPPGS